MQKGTRQKSIAEAVQKAVGRQLKFYFSLASCHTGENLKHFEDKLQVGRISFIWF